MSPDKFKNVGVVILAAGMGKRMQSTKLKVMHELNGQPMIEYVVCAVEAVGLSQKPVVVICNDDPSVQNYLGTRAQYAVQTERLGTGHAVRMAEAVLASKVEYVVVLNGDLPFVTADSLRRLIERHLERQNLVTITTTLVPNFEGINQSFYTFGRILRNTGEGHIKNIQEKKDCTDEQLQIKEVNTGFYCFNANWMWKHLGALDNNNMQKEYYLTDLIKKVIDEGGKISSIDVLPKEAIGINTKEDLVMAQSLHC